MADSPPAGTDPAGVEPQRPRPAGDVLAQIQSMLKSKTPPSRGPLGGLGDSMHAPKGPQTTANSHTPPPSSHKYPNTALYAPEDPNFEAWKDSVVIKKPEKPTWKKGNTYNDSRGSKGRGGTRSAEFHEKHYLYFIRTRKMQIPYLAREVDKDGRLAPIVVRLPDIHYPPSQRPAPTSNIDPLPVCPTTRDETQTLSFVDDEKSDRIIVNIFSSSARVGLNKVSSSTTPLVANVEKPSAPYIREFNSPENDLSRQSPPQATLNDDHQHLVPTSTAVECKVPPEANARGTIHESEGATSTKEHIYTTVSTQPVESTPDLSSATPDLQQALKSEEEDHEDGSMAGTNDTKAIDTTFTPQSSSPAEDEETILSSEVEQLTDQGHDGVQSIDIPEPQSTAITSKDAPSLLDTYEGSLPIPHQVSSPIISTRSESVEDDQHSASLVTATQILESSLKVAAAIPLPEDETHFDAQEQQDISDATEEAPTSATQILQLNLEAAMIISSPEDQAELYSDDQQDMSDEIEDAPPSATQIAESSLEVAAAVPLPEDVTDTSAEKEQDISDGVEEASTSTSLSSPLLTTLYKDVLPQNSTKPISSHNPKVEDIEDIEINISLPIPSPNATNSNHSDVAVVEFDITTSFEGVLPSLFNDYGFYDLQQDPEDDTEAVDPTMPQNKPDSDLQISESSLNESEIEDTEQPTPTPPIVERAVTGSTSNESQGDVSDAPIESSNVELQQPLNEQRDEPVDQADCPPIPSITSEMEEVDQGGEDEDAPPQTSPALADNAATDADEVIESSAHVNEDELLEDTETPTMSLGEHSGEQSIRSEDPYQGITDDASKISPPVTGSPQDSDPATAVSEPDPVTEDQIREQFDHLPQLTSEVVESVQESSNAAEHEPPEEEHDHEFDSVISANGEVTPDSPLDQEYEPKEQPQMIIHTSYGQASEADNTNRSRCFCYCMQLIRVVVLGVALAFSARFLGGLDYTYRSPFYPSSPIDYPRSFPEFRKAIYTSYPYGLSVQLQNHTPSRTVSFSAPSAKLQDYPPERTPFLAPNFVPRIRLNHANSILGDDCPTRHFNPTAPADTLTTVTGYMKHVLCRYDLAQTISIQTFESPQPSRVDPHWRGNLLARTVSSVVAQPTPDACLSDLEWLLSKSPNQPLPADTSALSLKLICFLLIPCSCGILSVVEFLIFLNGTFQRFTNYSLLNIKDRSPVGSDYSTSSTSSTQQALVASLSMNSTVDNVNRRRSD